jgi:hypothetical protein
VVVRRARSCALRASPPAEHAERGEQQTGQTGTDDWSRYRQRIVDYRELAITAISADTDAVNG